MTRITIAGLTGLLMLATTAVASAKCYKFSDTPNDVYVCVGKNGADSFDDRKKAKKVLEKAGYKPKNVNSSSSSCHSNSNKCYDENGKANRNLKGY